MQKISPKDYSTEDHRFQPGNPETGQPATRVTAEWLNSIQTEITHVIEKRGIKLSHENNQLLEAIIDIFKFGTEDFTYPIQNNVTVFTDLPHPMFDSRRVRAVMFNAFSMQKTNQSDIPFVTRHVALYSSFSKKWTLMTQFESSKDIHVLSVSSQGRLQYRTNRLPGDNYSGSLTLSHFNCLRA